jgi:hypothetical protein
MGVCICEKHGRSANLNVCAHVAERIDAGTLGDFHRFAYPFPLLVCPDCLKNCGLDRFVDHPELAIKNVLDMDDKVLDDIWTACERIEPLRTYCADCVAELERGEANPSGDP